MFGNRDIEHQTERLSELVSETETSINDMQAALNDSHRECANLAGKVAELQAQLAEKTERLGELGNLKLAGYLVRGTFFKSKSDAQKMADNITEYYENAFVDPVYLNLSSENASPLQEIHRAYGVEHVDTGVNDHE